MIKLGKSINGLRHAHGNLSKATSRPQLRPQGNAAESRTLNLSQQLRREQLIQLGGDTTDG